MPYVIGQLQSSENITEVVTTGATTFTIKNIPVLPGENGWIQITYCCVDSATLGSVKIKMSRFKRTIAGVLTVVNTTNLYVPAADTGMTAADCFLAVNADGESLNLNVTGVAAKDVKHRVQTIKNSVVLEDFATTA